MQQLHPSARWVFRTSVYQWLIPMLAIIAIVAFVALVIVVFPSEGQTEVSQEDAALSRTMMILAGFAALATIIGGLLSSEVYARMAYERYLYDLTKEGLIIERGIVWKKHVTIPYDRIQNVDIERGILARLLNFSSVSIHTAGYSGGGPEGYLPALDVATADQMRGALLRRIQRR
ncbi:PH domain-containing protein [Candidatus Woesearchaeota archaeon]|nr:PH domain-containing protein [Candidatus Woesearchaeota archaeon]